MRLCFKVRFADSSFGGPLVRVGGQVFLLFFFPLLVFLFKAFGVECHHNISIIASHPTYEAGSRSVC